MHVHVFQYSPYVSMSSAEGAAALKCVPCEGGAANGLKCFTLDKATAAINDMPNWIVKEDGGVLKLSRQFVAKNFVAAANFFNKLVVIAEEEQHHPDFLLTAYRNVEILIWYVICSRSICS
jgi:4a-hydroxytetrahydrobiopterin dehydratase